MTHADRIEQGEIHPVLLIGAPRSGTQLVRDMVASFDDVATWPFNEMNFMWRMGNRSFPTDAMPVDRATDEARTRIRSWFIELADEHSVSMPLDKTCQNCVRLDFVDTVLPEARYVYLERNGFDVVPSMMRRWQQSIPKGEFSRIKSIPRGDRLFYIWRTIRNQLGLLRPNQRTVALWGPRFDGMAEYADDHSLAETCAFQWSTYTRMCDDFFEALPAERVLRVRYEDLMVDLESNLRAVAAFLDTNVDQATIDGWAAQLRVREPGSGRGELGDDLAAVEAIIGPQVSAYEAS